jgi:hypothetical protein
MIESTRGSEILIIDGVYSNPNDIRNKALNFEYYDYGTDPIIGMLGVGKWPGRTSKEILRNNKLDLVISKYMGLHLRQTYNSGKFRIAKETEHASSFVHADSTNSNYYAGVLYLNDLEDSVPGTLFCTHKKTKTNVATLDGYKKIIEDKDDNDSTKWKIDLVSNVVFNRLIVFPGKYYHAVGPTFGNNDESARLVQLFFWEIVL